MPKDAVQILAEAEPAPVVKLPLAYYCTNCPWWTHKLKSLIKPPGSGEAHLRCPRCETPVRTFPLDAWLGSHKEDLSPVDYAKFMACFEENWDEAIQVQGPNAQ